MVLKSDLKVALIRKHEKVVFLQFTIKTYKYKTFFKNQKSIPFQN